MQPILFSILSAIANGIGASGAAGAQEQAARQAMGVQRDIWGQQQANQQPYLQAGQSSLADLLRLTQNPASVANDPGYQFRMQQGQQALERSAAARGGLRGGGTLRSLTRYSQGVASDEYNNAFNRSAHIAGMGQSAANSLGQFGGQYANNMGELYGAIGNAQSAGQMGVANAVSGGLGQVGGTLGDIFGAAMGMPNFGASYGSGGGANAIPRQGQSATLYRQRFGSSAVASPLGDYGAPSRPYGYG